MVECSVRNSCGVISVSHFLVTSPQMQVRLFPCVTSETAAAIVSSLIARVKEIHSARTTYQMVFFLIKKVTGSEIVR